MMRICFCLLLATPTLAAESRLPIEIRTPLGIGIANPSSLNEGVAQRFQVKEVVTFGADAVFVPNQSVLPSLRGWGLGLRFDSISSIQYDDSNYFEIAVHDFSFLIHYRWLRDRNEYGPFASLGFFTPAYVNQKFGGGNRNQFKASSSKSFALGLEWVRRMDVYLFGAQLAYHDLNAEGFRDANGAELLTESGSRKVADLRGLYAKFLLGIGF